MVISDTLNTPWNEMPVDPDLASRLRAAGIKARAWPNMRDRLIVHAIRSGGTQREVAELAGVAQSTVHAILQRYYAMWYDGRDESMEDTT